MKLGLYSYWRSSCSYRVRIALNIKQIDFEYREINLLERVKETAPTVFDEKNPMGQVPVLELMENNKKSIYLVQSLPIIEYLEESYPGTYSLLPKDTLLRQRVRAMAEVINSGIQPLQNLAILLEIEKNGGDKIAWSKKVIEKGLSALETMIQDTAGRFCVGDSVTLVDVFLIPQIYNAKRFGVNVEKFTRLHDVYLRCMDMDAFIKSSPEKQPDCPGPNN